VKKYLLCLLLTSCAPQSSVFLKEDNDLLKITKNNDNNYTQGLRLGVNIPDETGSHVYYGQQTFYTPDQKQATEPIPGKRPYAGWLSTGYDAVYNDSINKQYTLGVNVGVVGPSALAKQTQTIVHEWRGIAVPQGWDNQLSDEPALVLTADRRVRCELGNYADLIGNVGGNLGNVFTQGYTGVLARFGYNIPSSFYASDPIYPRMDYRSDDTSLYAFTSATGKGVLRNIFFDGNTFQGSVSVDKEPWVFEWRAGVEAKYKGIKIGYSYCNVSSEYETSGGGTDFGEVTLGWNF